MLRISHVFPPIGRTTVILTVTCVAAGLAGIWAFADARGVAADGSAHAASQPTKSVANPAVARRPEAPGSFAKNATNGAATKRTPLAKPGPTGAKPTGGKPPAGAAKTGAAAPKRDESGEAEAAIGERSSTDMDVDYDTPFPHRVNPFELPEEPVVVAGKQDDKAHPDVTVLGFANVDRPKVLVEINGMVATLAVGDRLEQVAVTSIEPPSVSFEFRRVSWTVSIFDEPAKPDHRPGAPSRPGTTVRAGVVRAASESPPQDRRAATSSEPGTRPGTAPRTPSRLTPGTVPGATPSLPTSLPATSPPAARSGVPTAVSVPAERNSDSSTHAQPGPIPPRLGVPAGQGKSQATLSPSRVPEVTRRLPPSTLTDSRKP